MSQRQSTFYLDERQPESGSGRLLLLLIVLGEGFSCQDRLDPFVGLVDDEQEEVVDGL